MPQRPCHHVSNPALITLWSKRGTSVRDSYMPDEWCFFHGSGFCFLCMQPCSQLLTTFLRISWTQPLTKDVRSSFRRSQTFSSCMFAVSCEHCEYTICLSDIVSPSDILKLRHQWKHGWLIYFICFILYRRCFEASAGYLSSVCLIRIFTDPYYCLRNNACCYEPEVKSCIWL